MGRSKKLIGIVLTLAMVFSMSSLALASDVTPYSSSTDKTFCITVTGAADGETYQAYKIFDATYDGDNYSYTIGSDSAWYGTVAAAADVFTLTQVNDSSTYIVTVNADVRDEAIIAVFTKAGIPQGAVAAAETKASDGQAVLDVTGSGAGYYYVSTSLGSLVMIDTTNPTPEIAEKNGIPTISKWVHENTDPADTWGHQDDAGNTDTILFELEIDNINGSVNLVVHDSMDDELEIPDPSDFHMRSVLLYTSAGAQGIALTEGTDYTITIGNCTVEGCTLEDCAFEIHFQRSFDDVDATGCIVITYDLLLDTKGDAYREDYEEIDNYAQITFGATSASNEVEAETYSFGFAVYKYTGDLEDDEPGQFYASGSGTALEGVAFELRNSSGAAAYFLVETVDERTIYLLEGWGDAPADYTQTLVTGSDGMIYVEGLDTGTYTLVETKALDGYNMLTGPVTVKISAEYDETTGALKDHTVTYTYENAEDTGVVYIENNTGSVLPGTGGMGTTIFYVIGVILVLGAAIVLVTRRRMANAE